MRKLFVSLEEFQTYSGNFDDDPEMKHLKWTILDSAQTVVEDYLGYHVIEENVIEDYIGTGSKKLFLHSKPVTMVNDLIVNGKHLVQDVDFIVAPDCVILKKGKFRDNDEILVDYCAGLPGDRIPAIIRETVLRIATLMLMEAGENIGITGKSFADNSRTFLNYNDYSKYLKPLFPLRSIKVM